MHRGGARWAWLSLACVLAAAPAFAQRAPSGTRLTYTRGLGAEGCPDEQSLRDIIAAQLAGTDPFTLDGPSRMDIVIIRREADFKGDVVMYDARGARVGVRELPGLTCAVVVEDIATTASIALRAFLLPAPAPAPQPPAAPLTQPIPPPTAAPPPRPTPDAAAPPTRPRFQIGAGALVGGGFAPAVSVGFGGLVGVRWHAASISLEGRGDLPASMQSVQTSWLGASIVPCLHEQWFLGCGLLSAGRVRSSAGDNATPKDGTAGYLGFGARLGLEVPLSTHLSGQLTGDLFVNALRPAVRVDGERTWALATVSELGALRLVAFF